MRAPTTRTPRPAADAAGVRLLVPAAAPPRLAGPLTRRALLAALGAGGAAALAGCGGGSSAGAAASEAASGSGAADLGTALNIYTWGEYDDPDVLKAFTAARGPAITLDTYGSNPELISKLSASRGTSGYDICVPTHSAIPQMVELDLLEELDHSLLPNMAQLDASVIDASFDPGNKHSVCKDWGSTGYVYDTTAITRPMASWADFIAAATGEASGSLSLLEDQAEVARIWFFANGVDPNTEDPAQIAAYRSWALDELAPHVQTFASSTNTAISSGSQKLIHCWNGDARLGLLGGTEPSRYAWVWPSEGGNLWQDNWAVVKGAEHVAAAHAFINDVLDPVTSLKELQYIGYNTGVKGIEDAARAAQVERPELIFIEPAVMSKLVYSVQNGQTEPVISIYDELKAKAGV